MNDGSILTSVKKVLGITEEYTHFDLDIIMHINTVIFTLSQLGVEGADKFAIHDKSATWNQLISAEQSGALEAVKSYVCLKVRLLFDPPTTSAVLESTKQLISELEWRINVAVDPKKTEGVTA